MKIENQVCSLELAKRLKELGVKQESIWAWCLDRPHRDSWVLWTSRYPETWEGNERYAAFTAAELGEMLPLLIDVEGTLTSWEGAKDGSGNWETWLEDGKAHLVGNKIVEKTEADARALMLIHLLENKLITLY